MDSIAKITMNVWLKMANVRIFAWTDLPIASAYALKDLFSVQMDKLAKPINVRNSPVTIIAIANQKPVLVNRVLFSMRMEELVNSFRGVI